ncbi:Gfo/Idh/MocA family protein [Kitasatospora mediocidica]|uniref:Gfo/Idh/MocA family protein n=1 Tax=Kitasatospora mediocidica TaxID=58352 RepID=UPI00068F1CCC|nr:Gfo/Idh/MocA family oxidoreductase [Kitasatospora mediocidica]
MINWGFIGAGSIARTSLAPAVHRSEGSKLHIAAARDADRAAALEPRKASSHYAQVIEDPDVDIVYVCLHNAAHRTWVLRALEAGKHVLCEKPLGLNADETLEMAGAAARHQRLLVEAAWNRWHPLTRGLERILAHGGIGTVHSAAASFDWTSPGVHNYRNSAALGGGALLDLGCYTAAAVLGAFDWQAPTGVVASATSASPPEADLHTEAELWFPQGRAQLSVGFTGAMTQSLDIRGSAGRIRVDYDAFTPSANPAQAYASTPEGVEELSYPPVDAYQLMVTDVAKAVAGEPAFTVPLDQSIAVASTLDRIRNAAHRTTR